MCRACLPVKGLLVSWGVTLSQAVGLAKLLVSQSYNKGNKLDQSRALKGPFQP